MRLILHATGLPFSQLATDLILKSIFLSKENQHNNRQSFEIDVSEYYKEIIMLYKGIKNVSDTSCEVSMKLYAPGTPLQIGFRLEVFVESQHTLMEGYSVNFNTRNYSVTKCVKHLSTAF